MQGMCYPLTRLLHIEKRSVNVAIAAARENRSPRLPLANPFGVKIARRFRRGCGAWRAIRFRAKRVERQQARVLEMGNAGTKFPIRDIAQGDFT